MLERGKGYVTGERPKSMFNFDSQPGMFEFDLYKIKPKPHCIVGHLADCGLNWKSKHSGHDTISRLVTSLQVAPDTLKSHNAKTSEKHCIS